jgi:hypothetical protein
MDKNDHTKCGIFNKAIFAIVAIRIDKMDPD